MGAWSGPLQPATGMLASQLGIGFGWTLRSLADSPPIAHRTVRALLNKVSAGKNNNLMAESAHIIVPKGFTWHPVEGFYRMSCWAPHVTSRQPHNPRRRHSQRRTLYNTLAWSSLAVLGGISASTRVSSTGAILAEYARCRSQCSFPVWKVYIASQSACNKFSLQETRDRIHDSENRVSSTSLRSWASRMLRAWIAARQ
jgi:hypothetical protein